jgi:hypothetical protein
MQKKNSWKDADEIAPFLFLRPSAEERKSAERRASVFSRPLLFALPFPVLPAPRPPPHPLGEKDFQIIFDAG